MKYFTLLVLVVVGLIWGIGYKANLDIFNGFKTAILTLTKNDLVFIKPRGGVENPLRPSHVIWRGSVESESLKEASGLAQSRRSSSIFFAINDSGNPPQLFALRRDGKHLGSWDIDYGSGHDFEDLSAFSLMGEAFLLIADTGDNLNWRKMQSLLILKEPSLQTDGQRLKVVRRLRFSFLDGHRDIESVAVDETGKAAYLVSKKRVPPELFRVSLEHEGHQTLQAIGSIENIPAPTKLDLGRRGHFGIYSSVPTALDFSNGSAIILTYKELYLFEKQVGENWTKVFAGVPHKIPLPQMYGLESATFAGSGKILLTGEREYGRRASEIFEVSY